MSIKVPELPQLPDVFMTLTKLMHHIGSLLEIDDMKDYGRFSFKGHPSMVHHWWIGAIMREVSEMAGAGLVMLGAKDAMDREEKSQILNAFNFTRHKKLFRLRKG